MANDFRSARFWAATLIEPAMYPGARAIDATMGNGWDTCWLCSLAGEAGHVYAFDVQAEAVARTKERLEAAGLAARATLFCAGHERMAELVDEPMDVVMFNLGWLPGAAHGVTTRTETTLAAVEAALKLLKPDGLLTVCAYPGHEEGARELEALKAWAARLDPQRFDAMMKGYLNQPNHPPQLLAVRKKALRRGKDAKDASV